MNLVHRRTAVRLFAAACLALTNPGPSARAIAEETVLLKPNHSEVTKAYIELETSTVQNMTGPDGNPMKITTRFIYGMLETGKPKGDGRLIELVYDRLLGYMSFTESMESLYDTDEPDYAEASPMHKEVFGVMLGAPLKITLDGAGIGTGVEGADAVREKLKAMGDQQFLAKTLLEGDLTDRQLMSQFGELPVLLYANREVKVGDTWRKTQHDVYSQIGKVVLTFDCKLTSRQKFTLEVAGLPSYEFDAATVSFEGTIAKDKDEKPAEGKRLGNIEATFKGTAQFDLKSRRFVEIKSNTQATIEVPPWWTPDPQAPLFKINSQTNQRYAVASVADREKKKADVARRVAEAQKKREAEEAAAMAGPVDPVTPENAPVPWLQWGGPDRNFSSGATGLANRWPESGPPRRWERELGDGYSAILCDGDTLYTMYSVRDKADAFKGDEIVVALDARTGKTLWEHRYPAPWPKGMQMEFGPGPHSTPLVVGDRLYTIGCTARLHCLDKATGRELWKRDLHEEFKADLHERGYGASPLAHRGKILVTVSKEKGHAVMAFEPSDGSIAWKGGDFKPGYASLLAIDVDGIEQLVAFTADSVMGLEPSDASTRWFIAHPTQWGANITTPTWCPQDDFLFITSAYGMGARGIKLEKAGSQVSAKEAWFNPKMKVQHGTTVRVGDHIYGSSGDFGPAFLDCVSVKTGEFAWRQRLDSRANVIHADGKLIVLDENGDLLLVKADASKYRLLGRARGLLEKSAWTAPTLVGRTLFLRDRKKIMALDLGAGTGGA